MRLRTRLAVLVCKASGAVLRRLGRGGTNLPGKLALKIDKNILGELSRGVKVTVVTGTISWQSHAHDRQIQQPKVSSRTSFANYFIKLYHNRSFYSNDFSKSLLFPVESKHFLLFSPISHFFPNSIGETY